MLIMSIVGSSAFLAAEDEEARVLWASNLDMSIPVTLNYPTANSTSTNSMIRVKVSVKENEVPTGKNSSRASIFATKASYISN